MERIVVLACYPRSAARIQLSASGRRRGRFQHQFRIVRTVNAPFDGGDAIDAAIKRVEEVLAPALCPQNQAKSGTLTRASSLLITGAGCAAQAVTAQGNMCDACDLAASRFCAVGALINAV